MASQKIWGGGVEERACVHTETMHHSWRVVILLHPREGDKNNGLNPFLPLVSL